MRFNLHLWPISTLLTNFNLLTVPSFQRESRIWNPETKALLIDSLLKGWKIPKIYLFDSKSYEIIDGQQRIFTIIDFLQNNFKIEINGQKIFFKGLDDEQKESFLNRKLDIELISDASDEEISILYSRLQEGASLNSAEKIHAITGKFSEFIEKIEKHNFFNKTNFRKKRFGVKSVCQQICFLEINGIDTAKFPQMREFFEENRDFNKENIKNRIISILDFMDNVFLQEEDYLSRAGNIISIFLVCSWLKEKDDKISPQKIYNFFNRFFGDFYEKNKTELDYINYNLYLIQSTSGGESILKRNEILRRHLCLTEPILIRNIETSDIIEFKKNMESSFGDKVDKIQGLIKEINERAIGNGKSRVFDFTTESSSIFTALSGLVNNLSDYERLIDLAWKSFYEGTESGNKIGDLPDDRNHRKPTKDLHILIKIDDLRKITAHDLEHDRATYEPKVKTACEIRDYWTGKKLPQDFDEYDFIVFQHKLIAELLEFVNKYNDYLKS